MISVCKVCLSVISSCNSFGYQTNNHCRMFYTCKIVRKLCLHLLTIKV